MKIKILQLAVAFTLLFFPKINLAQAPDLGTASTFALFTAAGAFANDGTSVITGDIGTNVGPLTGFPPGILIGQQHVADPASAQAATDVLVAYSYLSGITCGQVIGTTLGNNQILGPDVYCLGAASTLNGDLVLDGQGDPNALFIFKIDGALSTSTFANVVLINSASLCNVYWQVNGAFALGEGSVFRGTLLINGAIALNNLSTLFGRALSTAGRIDTHDVVVTINPAQTASITSSGDTTFCQGGSVTLTASMGDSYIWSTGETTQSITVNTSGTYSVTVTNGCGSADASVIVTVNPLPDCTISGNASFCEGQSTQLCAPSGNASYIWSTGETTSCITVTAAGTYSVTVTNSNGCTSTCSKTVTVNALPVCSISVTSCYKNTICQGKTATLCATEGTGYTYSWNTGATTQCITVSSAGTYTVTITNSNGCSSTCSVKIKVCATPSVKVTSKTNTTDCYKSNGSVTVLGSGGTAPYKYSITGLHGNYKTTGTFSRLASGNYTVYVADANKCTDSVNFTISKPVGCNAFSSSTQESITISSSLLDGKVLPNPAYSEFTLSLKGNQNETVVVRVIDMYGNTVHLAKGLVTDIYRFGNNFATGVYLVQVTQGNNVKTIRIVKQ